MPKNSRLEKLENSVGGAAVPGDVIHRVELDKNNNITVVYIVDGEEMTQGEFYRRWPNYQPNGVSVSVY